MGSTSIVALAGFRLNESEIAVFLSIVMPAWALRNDRHEVFCHSLVPNEEQKGQSNENKYSETDTNPSTDWETRDGLIWDWFGSEWNAVGSQGGERISVKCLTDFILDCPC